MPKLNINGVLVDLTVDELIEYQKKTTESAGTTPVKEPIIVPEMATETRTRDLAFPKQTAIFEINNDSDVYVNSRANVKTLMECGYTNVTMVRAMVVAANAMDERLGAPRNMATGWMIDRAPHERELLNNFGVVSRQRLYTPYKRTKKLTASYALGVSYWYTLLEFGYDDMLQLIERTADETLIEKVADRHTEIISKYLATHGVVDVMHRQRVTTDLETRKKLSKETFDLVIHEL